MTRPQAVVEQPDPDPAPNIRGAYPLAGLRVGPAWQDAWRVLSTGEWVSARALILDVAPRHGLSPQALDAVVRHAWRLGTLQHRRGDSGLIEVRRPPVEPRSVALTAADAAIPVPGRPHIAPPKVRKEAKS